MLSNWPLLTITVENLTSLWLLMKIIPLRNEIFFPRWNFSRFFSRINRIRRKSTMKMSESLQMSLVIDAMEIFPSDDRPIENGHGRQAELHHRVSLNILRYIARRIPTILRWQQSTVRIDGSHYAIQGIHCAIALVLIHDQNKYVIRIECSENLSFSVFRKSKCVTLYHANINENS